MGWYLLSDDERISLGRGRLVGREDFSDAAVLSRQHLKFAFDQRGLTVRDLGSRNGTTLNGQPLPADRASTVRSGDVLRVKDHEFRVQWSRPHLPLATASVAFVLLMKILDPAAALGRAVGGFGWTCFVLSAVVSSALVTLPIHHLVPARRSWLHLIVLCASALALDVVILLAANRTLKIDDRIAAARIEYHCATAMRSKPCTEAVLLCPRCAVRIERWRRGVIAENLEALNRQPATTGR